jgi:hypothetical protein
VAASLVLLTGCQTGVGWLEGAGFEVGDAIFERQMLFEGTKEVTRILVSDAGDLCDRIRSGRSLAGFSELAIQRWESGSVNIELRNYGDDCEIQETELASQGWVEDSSDDPYDAEFDVVFQTKSRSVSGRLAPAFCVLPEGARIGCE